MEDPIRNCVNTALAKGFLHSFEDLFNIAHNSSTLETEQLLSVNETLLEAESAFNLGDYEKAFGKFEELGHYFKKQETLEWAVHYFQKCRHIGETKVKKLRLLRIAYLELGLVLEELKKFDECIENQKLHVRCWQKEKGKEVELMEAYVHLYRAYRLKGNHLMKKCQNEEALEAFNLAVEASQSARNVLLEGEVYYDMGQIYDAQGKVDDAIESYRKYLKIAIELENKEAETRAYYVLGNAYRVKDHGYSG